MTSTSNPPRSEISGPAPTGSDSPSLSAAVRRGALWTLASNLTLRSANVALTALIAHILSPHDFGVFAVALTAYAIVASVGELGVSSCLIRADLDIDRLAPTVLTVSVLSSATLAGFMAVFARPIATALGSSAAAGPVRVLSLAVLAMVVYVVPYSQFARDFRQDKIFIANIVGFVPSTVLLIILAKSGDGAMAFAWSMVVRQFFMGFSLVAAVPRHYWPGFIRDALSVVLKFGLPLAGANFVNYILLNVDYVFVGHLLGAAALGVYMLAFTVASWPYGVLGAVINNVSMPAFSRVQHDPDLLKNATVVALRGVSLIVLPMCAMTIALARPLVLTMYGARWAASANVLVILSFYGAAFMACLLFANMLTSFGRTKFLLGLQLIWIGALVPAMVLGVHENGIIGAAYAHVAVIIPIVLPGYLLALKRVTRVRITALGRAILPALLASSAAALAARGVASQLSSPLAQLAAGLTAGGVVYVVCAGRLAVATFGLEPAAGRVLPRHGRAAVRMLRLAASCRGRHTAGHGRRRAGQPRQTPFPRAGLMPGSIPAGNGWHLSAGPFEDVVTCTKLAAHFVQSGYPDDAIPLYERALADQRRLLGTNHPSTLRSGNYLAAAYHQAGRLDDAVSLYEQTLARCTRVLGDDHTLTRKVRRDLSLTQDLLASPYHHP